MHLLAGMNDYRTIDMPFEDKVPGQEFGNQAIGRDAWLGLAKSFNGGQSWTTALLPGFPQDTSNEGLVSPLKLFGTAADPVVRAGTNGLFYYAGIAFNRVDRGSGVVFVARYIDLNNKENADTIKYDGVSIVDQGNAGQFLDKPWMAVDIPRTGHGHTVIEGQTGEIPCGNVYVAYSAFVGKTDVNIRSKIIFARSLDCGRTWSSPIKLSESQHADQGTAIAIDPNSGTIYVTWRRFATMSQANAILFVKSTDGGLTFTKPVVVQGLNLSFPAGPGGPFDQTTTGSTFRTNSHPAIAADQNGTVYLAWAERQANNQAKIVMTYSADGGVTWATPKPVDAAAPGHQFMPSLVFAGGNVMLIWYDQRNDEAQVPMEDYVADAYLNHRHTVDVRIARIEPANSSHASPLIHPSKQASRYRYKLVDWTPEGMTLEKLERSYTGLTMFQKGTVPFLGDYIDLTPAPVFVPTANEEWKYNTDSADPTDPSKPLVTAFHLAWEDTRDVKLPGGYLWPDWSKYRAPNSNQPYPFPSHNDSGNCDYTGMMNQNVYTACVTPGFIAFSPGNTKPFDLDGATDTKGFPIARAFTVTVKNMTDEDRTYRMTIEAPSGVEASFVQYFDIDPNATPPNFPAGFPVAEMDIAVASQSTLSRPVFVYPYPADPNATVKVHVTDVTDGVTASTSIVSLNPDPTNPVIEDPLDWTTPHLKGAEVHNPHLKGNSIKNVAGQEYLVNPHLKGLDPTLRDAINSDTANPHLKGDALNPHLKGTDIEAPHLKGTSISEIIWEVTNEGNTTTPYTFDTFVTYNPPTNTTDPNAPGYVAPEDAVQFQLLIYKVYKTPAAEGCALGEQEHDELIANIASPHLKGPHLKGSPLNSLSLLPPPDLKEATFWLNPGETALVKLWAIDPVPGNGDDLSFGRTGGEEVFDDVKAVAEVKSQAHNTESLEDGDYSLPSDLSAPEGPTLVSPAAGAELDNGCQPSPSAGTVEWDFSWAAIPGASAYHLYVLGPDATIPLIDMSSISTTSFHFSDQGGYIIEDNRYGWIWMVRGLVNGTWTAWSETRSFNVEPPTDCPAGPIATKLAFDQQPVNCFVDSGIPSFTVKILDSNDNLVTTATNDVSITVNSGTGTLHGTLLKAAINGIATFDDVSLDTAGAFTLKATSGNLTEAVSTAFNIISPPLYRPDQVNDVQTGTSYSCTLPGGPLSQSFVPQHTPLVAVKLRLRAGGSFPTNGINSTVKIRDGSPSGAVLGTAVTYVHGPNPTEVFYYFPVPKDVNVGNTYVIEWFCPGPPILGWTGDDANSPNSYPAGTSYGCTGIPDPDSKDFIFTTYTWLFGVLTDPAGDAYNDPRVDPDPDLVLATGTVTATDLVLNVQFAPGTFSTASSRASFGLDTDMNPATGHPGDDAGCQNDASLIGCDFVVGLDFWNNVGQATLLKYNGTCNDFTQISVFDITVKDNGMEVTVPMALLSGDGRMNFKVMSSAHITQSGSTGVLDYMSNIGSPVGMIR